MYDWLQGSNLTVQLCWFNLPVGTLSQLTRSYQMIIRRFLSQKPFKQGIFELFLIILGILIALQIDNWNESRIDRNKEKIYLNLFIEDFQDIIAELERSSTVYTDISNNMNFLLNESRKETPDASIEELNNAARFLIRMSGTPIKSTTYSNLTGSGDLSIIKSFKLKSALAEFYSQIEVIQLVSITHERQLSNIFQPYIVNNLDYTAMLSKDRQLKPVEGFDEPLILSVLGTQEFRNIISVKWDIAADLDSVISVSQENARQVFELLNEELKALSN